MRFPGTCLAIAEYGSVVAFEGGANYLTDAAFIHARSRMWREKEGVEGELVGVFRHVLPLANDGMVL